MAREQARSDARDSERPAVLIGKDTRISGYMLESALEAGLSAAGVDVMLAGPMPTPAVAYLTRALRLQAGIVISASHNPYHDNGIKFFSAGGTQAAGCGRGGHRGAHGAADGLHGIGRLGKARRIDDAAGRYIEFCKSTFPNDLDLRGLRIAVDCAHGAAYHGRAQRLPRTGRRCGRRSASSPTASTSTTASARPCRQSLRAPCSTHRADLGIALDGDGDRVLMADSKGNLYDGDQLLYVMARQRALEGRVAGVVGTLMTNLGFEHALERLGIPFARAKVGDRYVLEMMHERGWQLGGENSGHIICLDQHTTGDGIVSALQVLAALRQQGDTLAEACRELTLYPQVLLNVRVPSGFDWKAAPGIDAARQAAERELGTAGRILLRPSGTEPLLRVMVEGQDATLVKNLAQNIADAVQRAAA